MVPGGRVRVGGAGWTKKRSNGANGENGEDAVRLAPSLRRGEACSEIPEHKRVGGDRLVSITPTPGARQRLMIGP